MMTVVVDVGTQFAEYPFGRNASQGPNNGTRFREELLLPPLKRGERVVVDLTNTLGAAASFLEEAFGGLLRAGISIEQLRAQLEVRSGTDPSLIKEIEAYIADQLERNKESEH